MQDLDTMRTQNEGAIKSAVKRSKFICGEMRRIAHGWKAKPKEVEPWEVQFYQRHFPQFARCTED